MDLFEINHTISRIKNDLSSLVNEDDILVAHNTVQKIESEMLMPNFYDNRIEVKRISSILSANRSYIENNNIIRDLIDEVDDYLEFIKLEDDESIFNELVSKVKILDKKFITFETALLLDEEYDGNDALLEIHCGAGGTESQDWVAMLYRMYIHFSKNSQFKIDVVHVSEAIDVGLKSITIKIMGINAYGLLKNEKGVHRLIRVSPFDSSNKRHTTFALVSVSPILDDFTDVVINDSDIEVDTYRSSGAGGQSVNTTDSAVRIVHKPTNIVVTCQNQRSQLHNKQEALRVLKSKLLSLEIEKNHEKERELKGEVVDVNFGSQIRTYTFHPYAQVKDHRSNIVKTNPEQVLNGELSDIIKSVLKSKKDGHIK